MKKVLTLAVLAALLMAGSAFAQWGRHPVAQPNATFAFGSGSALIPGAPGAAIAPTTTNNDDSCDIGVAPAATLLLPYFQVDTATRGYDTFFTITNVSRLPQIAHVTLWTDWSYPVLDFNIFLTGYDVVPLSLYDIIVNGVIAPASLSSVTVPGTGSANANSPRGKVLNVTGTPYTSAALTANPNIGDPATAGCDNLPGQYRQDIRAAVQSALVNGDYTGPTGGSFTGCGTTQVGSRATTHANANTAVGYVTVDVSSVCSTTLPITSTYYFNEILFDNVLIGDYQILDKTAASNYAGGNPMVHIRAIPEGGPAKTPLTSQQTNFPYTFYSRYINGELTTAGGTTTYNATNGLINYDRRQPLPSTFAARYIQGGPLAMATQFRVWREGVTGAEGSASNPTTCANAKLNAALPMTELVRFDEHENANVFTTTRDVSPYVPPQATNLPESSSTSVASAVFPPAFTSGDSGGWMYLNLNQNGAYPAGATAYTTHGGFNSALYAAYNRASQNWVIVAMSGTGSSVGAYAVDFDAAWLGNGCTGAVPVSSISAAGGSTAYPGPAGGVPVCPTGATCGAGYTGTNTTPLP